MREIGRILINDYLHALNAHRRNFQYPKPPDHYLEYVIEGKAPVVLIPGLAEKWGFLKEIADDISMSGHPVFTIPELGYHTQNIPSSAKTVSEQIKKNKLQNVILITHSKGGLVGKHLLVYENEEDRIKGLIAIATPFSGSNPAKFIPHPSFKEVIPKSTVIEDLMAHDEVNDRIVSIYPMYDNHLLNKGGSILEGANNIELKVYGHHTILVSKELLESVNRSIEFLTSKE